MNVLVTGSSGLIGTALVEHLAANGHRVTRLVRGSAVPTVGRRDRRGGVGSRPDGPWIAEGLRRAGPFDGVVNLAGAGIGDRRWSPARKRLVLDSRTSATSLLVDSLLRAALATAASWSVRRPSASTATGGTRS